MERLPRLTSILDDRVLMIIHKAKRWLRVSLLTVALYMAVGTLIALVRRVLDAVGYLPDMSGWSALLLPLVALCLWAAVVVDRRYLRSPEDS